MTLTVLNINFYVQKRGHNISSAYNLEKRQYVYVDLSPYDLKII